MELAHCEGILGGFSRKLLAIKSVLVTTNTSSWFSNE